MLIFNVFRGTSNYVDRDIMGNFETLRTTLRKVFFK